MTAPLSDNITKTTDFVAKLNEWQKNTGGLTSEEYSDFADTLIRNKEVYTPKDYFDSAD